MKKHPVLSSAVSDKYTLNGIAPGKYDFAGFGVVDLTSLSLERADLLVDQGFQFLVPKKKKAQAEEPGA